MCVCGGGGGGGEGEGCVHEAVEWKAWVHM